MNAETERKATEAAAILQSDVFINAVSIMEDAIVRSWKEARTIEEREELHQRQRALRDIHTTLRACIVQAADDDARAGLKKSKWRTLLSILNQ